MRLVTACLRLACVPLAVVLLLSPGVAATLPGGLEARPAARRTAQQPPPGAPSPPATLRILSPLAGTYVSGGGTMIRAAVEPPDQAVDRMTFFVDGKQICAIDAPPYQCEWNAGTQILEHQFRVVAYLKSGQRLTATVRTKGSEYVEAVDVEMVQVTLAVLDGSRYVKGLPREAFRVFEDGVQQPISHFAAENSDLELAVGIDVSGSMTDSIGVVKENVKRFLSALRPADRVTLVAFNENFFVLSRPSADLPARLRAVDRLAPWGMTSLHESLVRSFDLLGTQSGRRGLVVFSDGEDTSSRVTREAVQRRAEASDAVLFMIGQGRAVDTAGLRDLCEWLAKRSGGRAFFPETTDGLRSTFDEITAELSSQYFLTYAPPASAKDDAWHQIRVEVGDGHYTVRHRQGRRTAAR
jgi:Ca-activated chloride channel homolog